jgi:hypothetical protein
VIATFHRFFLAFSINGHRCGELPVSIAGHASLFAFNGVLDSSAPSLFREKLQG